MLKRKWGTESNGKLQHLFITSKTATLVPEFVLGQNTLMMIYALNSWPTKGRIEGRDAMKPLCWRSVESKDAGRPSLTHHYRSGWNDNGTKWIRCVWRNGRMKFVVGKTGETPRETYLDSVSSTTKSTCSDRDANWGPQRWDSNNFRFTRTD